MFGVGPQELLVIGIIVLILFGGRKIPEVMRGLGEGLREFKRVSQEATDEIKEFTEEEKYDNTETDDKYTG